MSEIVGTIFICVAFVTIANLFFKNVILKIENKQLLIIGTIWLAMTVLFEFGLGIFILKQPIAELLEAYNILAGELWSISVITIFLTPFIVKKIKQYEQ